ncbi:hypothetical protein LINPERHAP2_LOCUS31061 [Linum perenne]
MYFHGSPSWSR